MRDVAGTHVGVETHGQEAQCQSTSEDGPLLHNMKWDCCMLATIDLEYNENADEEHKTEKAAPDFRVVPRICRA
jgi:hypothetical protein